MKLNSPIMIIALLSIVLTLNGCAMNYQNDTKVKNRSNHSHVEKSRNKFINPEVAAITAGTIVILGIVVLVAANVFCKALGQGFGHSLAGK